MARRYRYRLHSFLPKETVWLHPADMLAWQWRLEIARQGEASRKYAPRKDLQALIRPSDMTLNYRQGDIEKLRGALAETARENMVRFMASLSEWSQP